MNVKCLDSVGIHLYVVSDYCGGLNLRFVWGKLKAGNKLNSDIYSFIIIRKYALSDCRRENICTAPMKTIMEIINYLNGTQENVHNVV